MHYFSSEYLHTQGQKTASSAAQIFPFYNVHFQLLLLDLFLTFYLWEPYQIE